MTTHEIPFFFSAGSHRLFAVLHDASTGDMPQHGFVFCHPFAEEKLWAHRVFVNFARQLATRGVPVLRFDFTGNGDSDGRFSDSSIATATSDLEYAIDELKERTGIASVTLLGLRLGATIAAVAAERRPDVAELVLWAPIVDGARYAQELLRINLTTQMAVFKEIRADRAAMVASLATGQTVNVDGYELSQPMYEQLSALNLRRPSGFSGRCFIAQIDRAPNAKPNAELQQLQQQFSAGSLVVVQEDPFWKEIDRFYECAPNLFERTLGWVADRELSDSVRAPRPE
jgi:exosortase A-associated hydrolase 2